MFDKISDGFRGAINKIRMKDDEKALKKALDELKKSLLKSDVHFKVVKDLLKNVELDTKKEGIGKANFLKALDKHLTNILTAPGNYGFVYASKPPTIVMMTGLQGSGKTTTTAKLANYLKTFKKKKVLMVAADLQRLAAVEQLKQLAEQNGLDIYYDENAKDPVEVAKKGVEFAKEKFYDVVLIDTAGRLAIDDALMDELVRMKEAVKPHEIFYVADSLTGKDALNTAKQFDEKLDITGVILTKYDGDSKGGVALSIAHQVGKPLRFIGTGEKIADLEVFVPDRIVSRIMGAGDIESLVEKTSAVIDEKEAKKLTKKLKKGQFNYDDFLKQLEQMKKLGSMKNLLSMIPGMGNMLKQLGDIDLENSAEIKKIKAMINSMTKKERENPHLIKESASRRRRIARGAGLSVQEVNRINKQFQNAAKMAKKFAGKKMPDINELMKMTQGLKFPK
ncbi:signal recognition particle protein [Caminibacter pacificus]|uniref:Signal recognition particle protein n=1 Tax=Caminibacter pacificus TaxID=1424653 RepID=A0AAJ4RCQ9_9BACT|nr:signal recognition particle protein [Caminibacter pacificus]NPA87667.1 signal recognition particle protein [Campylobacterota bacterium]QCI27779.1 signal recognition particle protein [Caminibacter pacificus]ROR40046.1 signal recognition particle subunit FFH/SRP54 (srp54) [Caminibacter pacificus]